MPDQPKTTSNGRADGQAPAPDTKEEAEERVEETFPDLVLKTLRASRRPMSRRDIYRTISLRLKIESQDAHGYFASMNNVSVALNRLMKLQYVTKLGGGQWAAR